MWFGSRVIPGLLTSGVPNLRVMAHYRATPYLKFLGKRARACTKLQSLEWRTLVLCGKLHSCELRVLEWRVLVLHLGTTGLIKCTSYWHSSSEKCQRWDQKASGLAEVSKKIKFFLNIFKELLLTIKISFVFIGSWSFWFVLIVFYCFMILLVGVSPL